MSRSFTLVLSLAIACGASACGGPQLANDGTVVFPENGGGGASVMTANGLEYHDRRDVPQRIVSRNPDEPWRAPIGFILPRDGRFTQTSAPTVLSTTGLGIVLRPSDTRVPSWGGEVLVRIDLVSPAAVGSARWGENVAMIIDSEGADTVTLVDATLGQLSGRDRAVVVDAKGARVVVPLMPASHRSLSDAAVEKRVGMGASRGPIDLASALRIAREKISRSEVNKRIVLLIEGKGYDPFSPAIRAELDACVREHVSVSAIGASANADEAAISGIVAIGGGVAGANPLLEERVRALVEAVPASGALTFRDVKLTFEGTPAPSHVLEASGGDVRWRLDAGELYVGDVHAGEERTEIARVSVPPWVPGEQFHFTVTARVDDLAYGGKRAFAAHVPCVYDDDIERIAKSRNGDVITYASALATLRRLDAAFVGVGVERAGGLRSVAEMHARSMQLLARDMHDAAIAEQADLLRALLDAE